MTEVPASAGHAGPQPQARPFVAPVLRDDFAELYKWEMAAVTAFLMHQGASPYEASDAAHEAFTKLLPDLWRTIENPRAWLRTVAWRLYLRQCDHRTQPTDPVPDRRGGTCPVSELVLTAEQQWMSDALAHLPPAQRAVMAWRMDGFSNQEIARELGMTPVAVRQNYHRARIGLVNVLGLDKDKEDLA